MRRIDAPGAVALATAAAMRRFDSKLADADVATIATAIEENAAAVKVLNPKKARLGNAVGPATVFIADER